LSRQNRSRSARRADGGELPLSFNITTIQPAGPNTATADVTATGPQLDPLPQNMTFTDEGGWKVSREGALSLLPAAEHWGS
jgi:hypothetical protein